MCYYLPHCDGPLSVVPVCTFTMYTTVDGGIVPTIGSIYDVRFFTCRISIFTPFYNLITKVPTQYSHLVVSNVIAPTTVRSTPCTFQTRSLWVPLRLPSPGMFRIVYEVCEERAGELVAITRFEPSGVWGASKFNKEDKLLFTRALVPLFTVPEFWLHALAAMQVICRCQAFLLSPEEAPPDQWALPPLHRLWHLMAVVCENHRIGPQRAAIPWLLCLYEWAALAPSAEKIAFNKMMLGPATVVIRSDAVPPTISDITTIIQLTTMLLVRHKDFSTRPSSVVLGDTLPLPNDDPRTAYGVYIHILLRFPQHRDTILHTVSANLGEVGIWELELARTRVIGLLTASDMLEKDPKLFANIPESFAFNDAPQSIVAEREKEARDWEDGLCDNDLL